jgi:tetratricopeptide (TPR) repeat protein
VLVAIPQFFYRALAINNGIATAIVVACALSGPAAAQEYYSEGKAAAQNQDLRAGRLAGSASTVSRTGGLPSQSTEQKWLEDLGLLYEEAGLGRQAALSHYQRLAAAERLLDTTISSVLSIAEHLGVFCCKADFEKTRGRLVGAAGKAFASPTSIAWALSNLAVIYKAQGRTGDAITLLERALAVAARSPAEDYYRQGAIANRLALYCAEAGHAADAEAYLYRAIAAFEKSSDWGSKAGALYNLAALYGRQRRYPEAANTALESLSILTKAEEPRQSRTFDVLNMLGGVYNAQGRYKDAEQTLLRALAIAQEDFKSTDPRLSHVSANLGVIYKAEGRGLDAIAMFSLALRAAEMSLEPEDIWIGMIANRLAITYFEQRKMTEAELLFKRAIAIGEQDAGEDQLFLAAALFNLSSLYTTQARFEEAEALLARSLTIRRRVYGPYHPAVEEVQNAIWAVQDALQRGRQSSRIAGEAFAPAGDGGR